jgi:hypothetical protein
VPPARFMLHLHEVAVLMLYVPPAGFEPALPPPEGGHDAGGANAMTSNNRRAIRRGMYRPARIRHRTSGSTGKFTGC